jgi:hypothetical protein
VESAEWDYPLSKWACPCGVIDRAGGGGELMDLGTLHGIDDAVTGLDLAVRPIAAAKASGAELDICGDHTRARSSGLACIDRRRPA